MCALPVDLDFEVRARTIEGPFPTAAKPLRVPETRETAERAVTDEVAEVAREAVVGFLDAGAGLDTEYDIG